MPLEGEKRYTESDMQLASLATKTDILVKDTGELKQKLDSHIERQENKHEVLLQLMQRMVTDIVAPIQKEILRLDTIIADNRKETEEKIEYMREENKITYVTNRDFKVVRAVVTAVISVTGFIFMIIKYK